MSRLQYVAIILFIITTRSALGAPETKVAEKENNPIINGSTVSLPPIIEINPETPATPSNTSNATTSSPSSTQRPTTAPSTSEKPTKPTPVITTSVKTTQQTTTTATRATPTTTVRPPRNFDGPSFIGGIVLALGLVAIGFVAFKFYKARTELNYHTL